MPRRSKLRAERTDTTHSTGPKVNCMGGSLGEVRRPRPANGRGEDLNTYVLRMYELVSKELQKVKNTNRYCKITK